MSSLWRMCIKENEGESGKKKKEGREEKEKRPVLSPSSLAFSTCETSDKLCSCGGKLDLSPIFFVIVTKKSLRLTQRIGVCDLL